MRLRLNTTLKAALIAAITAGALLAGQQAKAAITIQQTYGETVTVDTSSNYNEDGVVYNATTGELTGSQFITSDTNAVLTFTLDNSKLDGLASDQKLVYVSISGATTTWGFYATGTNRNNKIVGLWNDKLWNQDNTDSTFFVSQDELTPLLQEDGKSVVLTANLEAGNNGTRMFAGKGTTGTALYNRSNLTASGKVITKLTLNKDLISSFQYQEVASTTVSSGSWSKEYASTATAVGTTDVGATLLLTGRLELKGADDISNLSNHGGDIVVGNSGQLFLQTWGSNAPIDLSNDFYIGSTTYSDTSGALRFGNDGGKTTTLNGKIYLIENAVFRATGNTSAANAININGKVTDLVPQGTGTVRTGSTLTIQDGKLYHFKDIDLTGLTVNQNAIMDFNGTVQVGKLNGAGTITDAGTNNFTINTAVGESATFSGALTVGGDLTKTEAGMQTLSGTVSVTGGVNVNAGTLVLGNTLTAATLSVAQDATLKLAGTEMLTITGSLSLAEGAILDAANIAYSSTPVVLGSIGGFSDEGAVVTNVRVGYNGVLSESGGNLLLTFEQATADLVWHGTQAQNNWHDEVWGEQQAFSEASTAIFQAGDYATTVAITDGQIANQVNVSGQEYTFDLSAEGSLSANSISVTGTRLTIQGSGTVTTDALAFAAAEETTGSLVLNAKMTLGSGADLSTLTQVTVAEGGTLAIEAGNKSVINLNAASTGTLEVKSGSVSYHSNLGGATLQLDGGTTFYFDNANGDTTHTYTGNIALEGNVDIQVFGVSQHPNGVIINGDISGSGKTLAKKDLGNLTINGKVELGTLSINENNGNNKSVVIINGKDATNKAVIGDVNSAEGTTLKLTNADVSITGANSQSFKSNLEIGQGATVTVADTDSMSYGVTNTIKVLTGGVLDFGTKRWTMGARNSIEMAGGEIRGTGDGTAALDYYQNGATISATEDSSISATIRFRDASHTTNFNVSANKTLTLAGTIIGNGALCATGPGTLILTAANTYSGGTTINDGTLAVAGNGTIGAVTIGENGTLRMDKGYTFTGVVSGAGKMTYAGTEDGTLNFGDKDISAWTGSFENRSSAVVTLNITRGDGRVNAAIGSADGGVVNITSANDVYFDNVVYIQDMTHNNSHTTFVETNDSTGLSGIITASGHVTTGRLVVGKTQNDAGSMFILSGGDAYLANGTTEHTYGAKVQGYGTFKLEGRATQTLTGDLTGDIGFHGTFWADGADSTLTLQSAIAADVTLKATNGGEIILKTAAKKAEVNNGTFDLLANVETLNVSGESNTLDMNGGSVANINLGGNLTANGDLTIYSGNTGTVVNAEAGKKLAVLGTANVDGRVQFTAAQDKTVDVTNTGNNEATYSLESDQMSVSAYRLEMIDNENGVRVSNLLVVNEIVNKTGKALTLDNVGDTLELLNMDITASTAQVYTELAQDTEATVSISDTLTAGGATLLANLTMSDLNQDGVLLLNVNGGNENALTLGSAFKIEGDTLVNLDQVTLSAIAGLTEGQEVILIKALQENGHELTSNLQDGALASQYFNGVASAEYTMVVNENEIAIKKAGAVPEPTTGTLSLLALAGLCARRRRK